MSCGNLYIGETITVIIVILFLALNRDIHKFFFQITFVAIKIYIIYKTRCMFVLVLSELNIINMI